MFYQHTVPTPRSATVLHLQVQDHQGLLPASASNKHQAHPDACSPTEVRAPASGWVVAKTDPVFMILATDYPQSAGHTHIQGTTIRLQKPG